MRYKSQITKDNNKHFYCSQKCSRTIPKRFICGKKQYNCAVCGKKFERYEIHVMARGKTFAYCSRKCNGIARAKKYIGENHPMWKGSCVGYIGLHSWVRKNLGEPIKCIKCGSVENVEWANKSRNYKRDLSDWLQLCKSCHSKFDNMLEKSWVTRRLKYGETGRRAK